MDKTKIILVTLLSLLALLCIGCIEDSTVNAKTTINAESVEDYDIAAANNAFAFDMYSMVKNNDENVFFSPYSIFTAMAICYDGAEGSTKEQMANVFYYPLSKPILEGSSKEMIDAINSDNAAYDLETANALWVLDEYPLNEQYAFNAKNYYDGMVTPLNFIGEPEKSADTINTWIAEKTNDKIKDLIPKNGIDSNTRLVITNTVYFNGKWVYEFEEPATRERSFTLSNGEEKLVDTMYNVQKFNYGDDQKAKILELPYKGNDLCMYIVLPKEKNIAAFEDEFSFKYYNKLKADMQTKHYVKTLIPKFKFNTGAELKPHLIEMGVVDAFNPSSANFTGIFDIKELPEGSLSISEVYHQAFIGVNEKGTEATAATAVVMEEEGAPDSPWEFEANHPFLFIIEDKRTGCILFMGKVEDPEYEEMS
ncbi:serpin family protein [Methanolobus sp. ZRKC5]|uniref:serpin family protein n=1 Tax=unclassified Methanolobus TaxID=2629569 RepID=UPI00313AFF1E